MILSPFISARSSPGTGVPRSRCRGRWCRTAHHPKVMDEATGGVLNLPTISCAAACQHAAGASNILTPTVTPDYGHTQLDAERVAKDVQLGP